MYTVTFRFDFKMYQAALAYYGLPPNYARAFKQKILTDRDTGEPILKDGKLQTILVSCKVPKESIQGNAVWVQVNEPFEGAALRTSANGEYTYPKKAKNSDIKIIHNVPLDFEYPQNPQIAHEICHKLIAYLIEEELAEQGLPGEDTGAGDHIGLPITPIETTPETADRWNLAVATVVKSHIKPEFDRLCKDAGIVMDLSGFDISRVLSLPGTWRPYNPDKNDCEALKQGYLRRWLAPYTDGNYPTRKESTKLAQLIRDTFDQMPKQTGFVDPAQWLRDYAASHPNADRSGLFQSLVNAAYLKYDEHTVFYLKETINTLSGEKYNGRIDQEISRSLDLAKQLQKESRERKSSGSKEQEKEKEKEEAKPESALTRLMRIADEAHLICTPSGALYARVPVNGHHEIVSVSEKGSGFRRWLVYEFKRLYGIAPNSDALSQTMSGVQADAEYASEKAKIHTRIAEKDGCIYLDLANEAWECVEISPDGWRVISCPPVYFRRPSGMLPLPIPVQGGDINELRMLINTKEEKDYVLIVAWLIGTLHPKGPYPALNLNGERGSTKSKTTTILRNLIDPNEAPTRNAPKDEREAAITAQNNMVIALDNLSSMPLWLSDLLCRIATGSGFSARELYTDDAERVFNSKRPIIMNGIEDGIITQGDLLSRTILVTLQPPELYQSEETIDELFDVLHPELLGALLTIASTSLKMRKEVILEDPPRMADFAIWVAAAEPVLGWEEGTFIDAYIENQANATSIVMEASPIAKAIVQFMDNHKDGWEGMVSDLHNELEKYEVYKDSKIAPKAANKLGGQLKRIASTLRIQGIDVQQIRKTEGMIVKLSIKSM